MFLKLIGNSMVCLTIVIDLVMYTYFDVVLRRFFDVMHGRVLCCSHFVFLSVRHRMFGIKTLNIVFQYCFVRVLVA